MNLKDDILCNGVFYLVSTNFLPSLSINLSYPYETMVFFNNYENPRMESILEVHEFVTVSNKTELLTVKYKDEDSARLGHEEVCKLARNGEAPLPYKKKQ